MARRRKPGRPKGSKNKKRSKSRTKRKATPAQLRNLKKARAVRAKNLKKTSKKAGKKRGRKSATYHKRVENLKKARAARELKNMPKTQRMALKQLHADMMADTVRGGIPSSAPSILHRVRRHMPTMVSRYN
jgi:hypothetical protein